MFSLTDHNTRKAYIIAVVLKKFVDSKVYRKLAHHIVIARSIEEAYGILRLAYVEKDRAVEFEMWSTFTDMLPENLRTEIDENNSNLVDDLLSVGPKTESQS